MTRSEMVIELLTRNGAEVTGGGSASSYKKSGKPQPSFILETYALKLAKSTSTLIKSSLMKRFTVALFPPVKKDSKI